jgi:serine/threonine protein kinase
MLSGFLVELSDFQKGAPIGHGSYGEVFSGVEKSTGQAVAIKCLVAPASNVDSQKSFLRELQVIAQNEHPGTLRLIGFKIDLTGTKGPVIVTALMPNGTLGEAVQKERKRQPTGFDATAKSKCVFGIAAAMAYVHSKGILHRDLKPENVFLTAEYEPVVADFGISRYCEPGVEQTASVGSPLYMAPELISGEGGEYSFPVDVFAFAVTVYCLFADPVDLDDKKGRMRSHQMVMKRIVAGARLMKKPEIPPYYWELITKCWDRGPDNRPPFLEIVEEFHRTHEYILAEADRAKVLAYEKKVYQRFESAQPAMNTANMLTEDEAKEIQNELEALLREPIPSLAQVRNPILRSCRNLDLRRSLRLP